MRGNPYETQSHEQTKRGASATSGRETPPFEPLGLVRREDQNSIENSIEKPIKTSVKIKHKFTKINEKSTKNLSWRALGRVLEALAGHTRKRTIALSFFEASWNRLGRLLGPSWRSLGAIWGCFGLQNGIKMVIKSIQKSIEKMIHLGIDFGKDFGGFGEAKWTEVGTRKTSKMDLILKKPTSQKHP